MNRVDLLLRCAFALLFVCVALARPAAGQCPLQWQPGDPIPSVCGSANATTVWDPDGAGPAPAVLVVGGRFAVGTMLETSLATFDGSSWAPLGTLQFPKVTALTVWNGMLVAAGGTGLQHAIAAWNGSAWTVLGNANGPVNAMVVFNGNLIAGGSFSILGGASTRNIAQWNGSTWSEPGLGVSSDVLTMAVFGSLWVGGQFGQAGLVPVAGLAVWNGTSWAAAPGSTTNWAGPVRCLAARSGTTPATSFLFAGGQFISIGGVQANKIARFSLATNAWTAIPGLPGTSCNALHVRSTSATTFQLHAAVSDPTSAAKVWRLSGSTWVSLGDVVDDAVPEPTSLTFFNGQYVAAFANDLLTTDPLAKAVRVHDGTAWQPLAGPGFDDRISAVTSLGNDIVVGGRFRRYGSTSLERIARGRPGNWQALGTGIGGGMGVFAVCTMPNGDLFAGGDFTTAGGAPAGDIARWDGTSWSAPGSGSDGMVNALLALPNGELIAVGAFSTMSGVAANNIARWNGTTWLPLGAGTDGNTIAVCRLGNGDLVVTGSFSMAGGLPASRIARWNGVAWSNLGSGVDDGAFALAELPGGDVLVGGSFQQAGGVFSPAIARWNGSTFLAQSTPNFAWDVDVETLLVLPNGEYFAGGQTSFFGLGGIFGGTDSNLARHTGGATSLQWDAQDLLGREVVASTLMPNGDVVVAGRFDAAGGLASHNVAVLRTPCPATVASHGAGCIGSGGANVLGAVALPWTGGTFRGRATGMPSAGIAFAVTGLLPNAVPMPSLLPQGVPGCTLLASPDLFALHLPVSGVVATELALPNAPALAGINLYHQVVPVELDAAGQIVAVTGTNGLLLTTGAL